MGANIAIDDLRKQLNDTQAQLRQLAGGQALDTTDVAGPRLQFTRDENLNPDFETKIQGFGAKALDMWQGKSLNGVRSDSQIVTHSQCALTHVLAGFYQKQPLKKPWAEGEYITITDAGATAGDRVIEWERRGDRHTPVDDDIMAPDDSPQRDIDDVWDVQTAKRAIVKNKIKINWFAVQEAARRGYDKFEAMGMSLRRRHMRNIDNIIRRGNVNKGIRGIVNYPGVRRRVAAVDWGTANAGPIYDDYNACLNQVYASPTEEDLPAIGILPRLQWRHFQTEQFSAASDTTLKTYIERNNDPHQVVEDPGLATAGPNGFPVGILMTPRRDLVFVTAPLFAEMQNPVQLNASTIEIEIWTVLYGAQVNDEDTILIVDGEGAGWGRFGDGS